MKLRSKMKINPPPITQCIEEAVQMLLDRSQFERDLIYSIATLEEEYRSAIILAYRLMRDENEPNL